MGEANMMSLSFNQSSPSGPVCPGDRLVFTCVTVVEGENGVAVWRRNNQQQDPAILAYGVAIPSLDDFTLNITSYDNTTNVHVLVSTATNPSVPVELNTTTIGCSADAMNYHTLTINIAGQPTTQITNDYFTLPVPPIQYYIISVYNTSNSIIYTNNTTNTNITITGLPLTDTNYTVTIISVNIIGYGPSTTVNVSVTVTPTVTTSSITNVPSSVTLTTDISTSTSVTVILSTSITVSSTIHEQSSSSFISATSTSTGTTSMSVPVSSSTVSTTAAGSNAVPIISGAIGTVFVIIIIIIIILVLVILAIKKQRSKFDYYDHF
ncbi:PREDICTED: location of vulva defective 1-like [Amphimedon queenslandica]|uniref:Fibronectin type-III domain-containing protein n=1 Tax=Amphimedon queenslandica TaxID=400682 RepID=A0AAN0JLL3_AMPQE|nr:PREDICTED: location of vulva defective 1-like [Amphimedon queenslandica]|eukprot:XP_019857885.1 PREDICTED: location of vulva defective 1-like [Amphimedon queenslandica]